MKRTFLKSKIHHPRVTHTKNGYVGSVAIDRELLKKANILPYEKIHVFNVNNGKNFVTYAIPGEKGMISVQGSSARHCSVGDRVNILVFTESEKQVKPAQILVNEDNSFKEFIPLCDLEL